MEPNALLAQLKSQLQGMSSETVVLPQEALSQLRLGETQKGTFFSCDPGGRKPVLNPDHKAIRRLLNRKGSRDTSIFFLMSAVYSVINRADPEIHDHHEREFHSRLLHSLLEP